MIQFTNPVNQMRVAKAMAEAPPPLFMAPCFRQDRSVTDNDTDSTSKMADIYKTLKARHTMVSKTVYNSYSSMIKEPFLDSSSLLPCFKPVL